MRYSSEQRVIEKIAKGLPLTAQPFKDIAEELSLPEYFVIRTIRTMLREGQMKKLCASLNHRKLGFVYNAMVMWNRKGVTPDTIAALLELSPEITHAYERESLPGLPYTFFTMVHAKTEEDCEIIIECISKSFGMDDYAVLYSERELKKTGMHI